MKTRPTAACRYSIIPILSLALVIVTGCSPEPKAELRIGINAWPGYEFLYLAQEKGFYRDEGLAVRLVEFNSLSDARRAYERGQIDGLGATVIEVLQAREHSDRSPQIVQIVDYSDGADVILVRPGITNGAALRGKRIGVELGSLGVYVLARCLDKHGLNLSDVIPVASDQLSMESSFNKGELDAVVTYPPTSVNLLKAKTGQTFFTTTEIPGEVVDVIAVEADIVTQRAGDVAKLIRAFHKAVDYTSKNPADAHAIMAKREGITAKEFAEALSDGIKLVPAAQQAEFLRPGGKLATVIDNSDRILRLSSQIKGPDRRPNISNASFATADDSSK